MSKVYGYVRVSTQKQNLERQIRNIKAQYPDAIIVQDKWTGTEMDRPCWNNLRKRLKDGDTVIFDEVSRMSRDAEEGFTTYTDLFDQGINLKFIKEPHLDTSIFESQIKQAEVNTGKDYLDKGLKIILLGIAEEQIRLAFKKSESEVEYLHQRISEGIETARLNGKQIGQKPGAKLTTKKSIMAKEIIRQHSKDFGGSLSDAEVIKLIGCARGSYYKYKRELKTEP